MAKRSRRNVDIHHPNMVKTIFVLTSLAIVGFLVLIVKTTSFKSEPQAAKIRWSQAQIARLGKIGPSQCSKKYGGFSTEYKAQPVLTFCPSGFKIVGTMLNPLNEWVTGGIFGTLDPVAECCRVKKDIAVSDTSKFDSFCSNIPLFDGANKYLGRLDMRCKPSCSSRSITDTNNLYNVPTSFYQIIDGKYVGDFPCAVNQEYGNYSAVRGTCCSKDSNFH